MRYWLPTLITVALAVYALVDIVQHPDVEPFRLPKAVWILVVIFAPIVGALAWIVTRWVSGGKARPSAPPRAMGPDDDPSYQTWLREQERRRRQEGGRD